MAAQMYIYYIKLVYIDVVVAHVKSKIKIFERTEKKVQNARQTTATTTNFDCGENEPKKTPTGQRRERKKSSDERQWQPKK